MSVTNVVDREFELEHPWLVAVFVFGIALFFLGFVTNLIGHSALAGFFALFAVVTVIMVGVGYAGLFLLKYLAKV